MDRMIIVSRKGGAVMETQIFTKENLDIAAKALQQGEVVSFPTETVYGLGAIATSQEAVLKVFEQKDDQAIIR